MTYKEFLRRKILDIIGVGSMEGFVLSIYEFVKTIFDGNIIQGIVFLIPASISLCVFDHWTCKG
jgi:hypothetical protein